MSSWVKAWPQELAYQWHIGGIGRQTAALGVQCAHQHACDEPLQRELAAFMAGVNPGVRLTPIQMREIVDQVRRCQDICNTQRHLLPRAGHL